MVPFHHSPPEQYAIAFDTQQSIDELKALIRKYRAVVKFLFTTEKTNPYDQDLESPYFEDRVEILRGMVEQEGPKG